MSDLNRLKEVAEKAERTALAKSVLAAWCNVPVEALPAEKMWIEHPNDDNRRAWDRVIAAAQAPLLSRIAALEGALERAAQALERASVCQEHPPHAVELLDERDAARAALEEK